MEAIVPAFLLALLSQLGDRPALLTAILADRYGRPVTVALAAGLAHLAGNGVAAAGGMAIAPMLTPEAQSLLLSLALLMAGFGGLWKIRATPRFENRRIGAALTTMFGVLIVALGDSTQFFTLALATRGEPWFAATGATIGAFAIAFVAATLGEEGWRKLPLARLRAGIGILFLIAGVYIGLGALRLL